MSEGLVRAGVNGAVAAVGLFGCISGEGGEREADGVEGAPTMPSGNDVRVCHEAPTDPAEPLLLRGAVLEETWIAPAGQGDFMVPWPGLFAGSVRIPEDPGRAGE